MPTFTDRLAHAWNAFMNKDPTNRWDYGAAYANRPDRIRTTRGNERTLITSVYNRISVDCAAIDIKHVKLDDRDRYMERIQSGLNNCFTLEANIDQQSRNFVQDIVMSMLDEGCVAIVPIDTKVSPISTETTEINTMRTGKIVQWYPQHVRIRLYNDKTGLFEEITLPKKAVGIIENPFYSVMNEPNSTMQRLIHKLNLLDIIDEQKGANKLDLIIQLPYIIKTEARRQQAENRRKDIEKQLSSSNYGIAYTDGTERITQLNRSVDNQLFNQVETLTRMLYSQLGLTEEIMNGTADENALNNYYNRTIEPIMSAIVGELKRKFLTKTARSQKQSIMFFRDPFKLVPTTQLAELADKFTRNEIMSSNEFRQVVGMQPSQDPNADVLRNKNLSPAKGEEVVNLEGEVIQEGDNPNKEVQNGSKV